MYQKGFSQLVWVFVVAGIIAIAGGGFWYYKQSAKQNKFAAETQVIQETPFNELAYGETSVAEENKVASKSSSIPIEQPKSVKVVKPTKTSIPAPTSTPTQNSKVNWSFDGQKWQVNGNPPDCPNPLEIPAPVDVRLATGILYPGQIRGGDYKPHGGFRFDNRDNNEVDVYAPMDGSLFKAARHLELGEVQYSLYFINDCGIMYKLDHLRELTPRFEKILSNIPMGGEGDSRTTEIRPAVFVVKGEHVATKIGFENFPGGYKDKNIFVDFGLYDLRKTNGVNYDTAFRAKYPNINEYGTQAVCWLDYLKEPEKTIVKNLPADGAAGKISDYCL